MLPGITSAYVSIVCLVLFLRFWKPKSEWRFPDEKGSGITVKRHPAGAVFKAWVPFIVLTLFVACWGLKPVNTLLDAATLRLRIYGLHASILAPGDPAPMDAVFRFNWLSAGGTAILCAAIVSAVILRVSLAEACSVFWDTVKGLRYALLTVMLGLGFAYLANFSGLSRALGLALTSTGGAFPFLAAFIGWIGAFITGSDTSSNALFAKLQAVAAKGLGISPVLAVAANTTGAVAAKMVSPQSIAVATASTGLVGKEGELFRRTFLYSIGFGAFIGVISYLQAHYLKWMIPERVVAETGAAQAALSAGPGLTILAVTVLLAVILGLITRLIERRARELRIKA